MTVHVGWVLLLVLAIALYWYWHANKTGSAMPWQGLQA